MGVKAAESNLPTATLFCNFGLGLVHGVMTVMRNPAVNCTVKPTHHDQVNEGEGRGVLSPGGTHDHVIPVSEVNTERDHV